MHGVGDFLEKFKKLYSDKLNSRTTILQTCNGILGSSLGESSVTIKNHILYIKASPVLRMEIELKKTALLEALKSQNIVDIR